MADKLKEKIAKAKTQRAKTLERSWRRRQLKTLEKKLRRPRRPHLPRFTPSRPALLEKRVTTLKRSRCRNYKES